MNSRDLMRLVASRSGYPNSVVEGVFASLCEVVREQLSLGDSVIVPDICKLRVRLVPPERRNLFLKNLGVDQRVTGSMYKVYAKPLDRLVRRVNDIAFEDVECEGVEDLELDVDRL